MWIPGPEVSPSGFTRPSSRSGTPPTPSSNRCCGAERKRVRRLTDGNRPFTLIAGGLRIDRPGLGEADLARSLGYDAVLLSLSALRDASDTELLDHCRRIGEVLPLVGSISNAPSEDGDYGIDFWRGFARLEAAVAVKIAPFNRYATLDVVRAIAESGRDDLALYTGNDDNILHDSSPHSPGARPRVASLVASSGNGPSERGAPLPSSPK